MMLYWTNRYYWRDEFMALFIDEQDYVDAMFANIIMFNFGIAVVLTDRKNPV